MKEICIKTDYILLGQFLKFSGIVVNGGEVKDFIKNNVIVINGVDSNQRSKKIYPDDVILINGITYKIVKGE